MIQLLYMINIIFNYSYINYPSSPHSYIYINLQYYSMC